MRIVNDHRGDSAVIERVGSRVRRLRAERAMTVRELAERSGLSPRFISQLEAGEANIAIGRLAALAAALGSDLRYIVEDDGERSGARAAIERLLAGRTEEELAICVRAIEAMFGERRHAAIALLGLRGAGKSTLGPRAARKLGMEFVELDERIELAAGLDLAEIFSLHGEGYYRRLESHCLSQLLAEAGPCVVALPGGIVNNEEAFGLVKRCCTTVWLKARPEEHMTRVLRQGDRRPVEGSSDAMAELRAILATREPLYRTAEITIDTSSLTIAEATKSLVAAVRRDGW